MYSHPLLTLFSAPGSVGTPGPLNTAIPVISGMAVEGETLTTTDGGWLNSPTFTYQWKRDGVDIGSATNATYVIVSADVGKTITAIVTATNADSSASATSAGVVPTAPPRVAAILALVPIAYYKLNGDATDSSGNGYNGTVTNATFSATEALFDGTGDYIDISAMLPAFNRDAGTLLVWGETSAWADATERHMVRISDAIASARIEKTTTTNQLLFRRISASGMSNSKTVTSTALAGSTAQFCACLTWDVAANALKAYINGTQVGTTQTGLTTWPTTPTAAVIGAFTTDGTLCWNGGIADVAIFDRALTGAEVASVSVL